MRELKDKHEMVMDIVNQVAAIAVKLGAGDTLALDATGWAKATVNTTTDTYTHATSGTEDYVITVTHPVI